MYQCLHVQSAIYLSNCGDDNAPSAFNTSTQPYTQLWQKWTKRLPTLSLTIQLHGCFADKPVRWQALQIQVCTDIVRSTHFCIITIITRQDCNSHDNCIHLASCQQNILSANRPISEMGKSSESVVCYAEGLWRMRRHGPVIVHCTDSEDFPWNVLSVNRLDREMSCQQTDWWNIT